MERQTMRTQLELPRPRPARRRQWRTSPEAGRLPLFAGLMRLMVVVSAPVVWLCLLGRRLVRRWAVRLQIRCWQRRHLPEARLRLAIRRCLNLARSRDERLAFRVGSVVELARISRDVYRVKAPFHSKRSGGYVDRWVLVRVRHGLLCRWLGRGPEVELCIPGHRSPGLRDHTRPDPKGTLMIGRNTAMDLNLDLIPRQLRLAS